MFPLWREERRRTSRHGGSRRIAAGRRLYAVYPELNWIFFNSFHFARGRDAGIVNGYLCATATPIRSKFSLFLNWKWEVRPRKRERVWSSTFVSSRRATSQRVGAIALFHADAYTGEGRDAEINLITSRGVDSNHRFFRLKSE